MGIRVLTMGDWYVSMCVVKGGGGVRLTMGDWYVSMCVVKEGYG